MLGSLSNERLLLSLAALALPFTACGFGAGDMSEQEVLPGVESSITIAPEDEKVTVTTSRKNVLQPTETPSLPNSATSLAPYKREYSENHGEVTLSLQDGMKGRTICPNPYDSNFETECTPMQKITLNTETYDALTAARTLQDSIKVAKYEIWKARTLDGKEIQFEQFNDMLRGNEPLYITALGYTGGSYLLGMIEIDLRIPIEATWVREPRTHKFSTGNSTSYRLAEGKLIIEIYDFGSGGTLGGMFPERAKYASAGWLSRSLSYLSSESAALTGGFLTEADRSVTTPIMIEIMGRLRPDGQNSVLIAY